MAEKQVEILRSNLPGTCIEDCSASGAVDDAVHYWCGQVGNVLNFPREAMIDHLLRYGAWAYEELTSLGTNALKEKILWLACCDFREDASLDAYYLCD